MFQDGIWRRDLRPSELGEDEVRVWRVEASAALMERCASVLDEAERARAGRYRVASARDEFVLGRGCLRMLLGGVLGVAPDAVELLVGEHGKLGVAGGVEFNVAHSHGEILIALALGRRVGVDVERVDGGVEWREIARDQFTAREMAEIEGLSGEEARVSAFYRIWVRKEAVTKADGRGLTLATGGFEVAGEVVEVPGGVRVGVRELEVEAGFAAALAVEGGLGVVRLGCFFG